MRNNIKDINIKKPQAYYFFNDIVNIKDFDPNNVKIDEKSYKNIYYNVTIKDSKYLQINSVNSLHLMFNKINGYFEEINANKYLTIVPTNKNK